MNPEIEQVVRQTFLAECQEDFPIVEQALLALEQSPEDRTSLATVFRKFHSLKGSAATLGLDSLSAAAHRIEDLLDRVRSGAESVTPALVTFLLQVVDTLREAVPLVVAGQVDLPARCRRLLERVQGGRLLEGEADGRETAADDAAEREHEGAIETARTLRIDVGKLDLLLSTSSEIAIARGRLRLLVERLGSDELSGAYRSMESLLTNLHHFVTNVRMVPIKPLLTQFARVVRDLSLEHDKEMDLVISDQGVEVDTSVVEQIRAPLTQMIRNAVHHGIEPRAARVQAGKHPRGRIDLRARHEAGGIVIEVEDDGRGLDRQRILERAQKLGLVTSGVSLSDAEVHRLIFHQGLSTATDVSSTSGRGVGMDVVMRNLNVLGGEVEVRSQLGRGTLFIVRMPLTLAIIDGLLVQVGEETFGLPMAGVVRCLDVTEPGDPNSPDGVLNLRGEAIPYLRLRSVLGVTGSRPAREVVIVIQQEQDQVGLAVDRLLAKAQIVVKPAGRFFKGIRLLSGLTILGDGRVAPILNVPGLFAEALSRTARAVEHRHV